MRIGVCDAISLWQINSPFVLLKTTDWPGLVRAEAGQTINKLVASSLQIQSVAGPLGPISGDATVWKQRRAEESPYFTPFWILIRMKQMSQALIVSWTARHGDVTLAREDLCNISKDWDSLAWENVPQSFNSEIWEALKSEWLPLNCDSFK